MLASGRGSNFAAIADAIERGDLPARIACLISDVAGAPALGLARARGIPAVHVDPAAHVGPDGKRSRAAFERATLAELRARGVELVVLAGFMRLLGGALLDAYPLRVVNVHPALLPAFPGLDAQRQALEHGVKVAGCTVHFVDRGVDSGPIIAQRAVPVREDDTVETLSARILEQEHDVYWRAIRLIAEGRLRVEGRRVRVDGAPDAAGG